MGQDIYMEWDSNGAELLHTPGGVQDIYAEAVILELHNGGCDGYAALLLYLHPVGHGVAGVPLALDHTGQGYGPAVEQELFRQGGLARVGVGDYGEGAALFYFGSIIRHDILSILF